jgi:hypothetical protein
MKLKDYLAKSKKKYPTRLSFAEDVGVSVDALFRWLRGSNWPSRGVAKVIVQKTGGEVSMEDIYG